MSPLPVIIRPCREEDLDDVYTIELNSSRSPWSFRSLSEEMYYPFSRMYVAEYSGVIVGFSVSWIIIDEIQLNNIAVEFDYRRKGVASALLDHLIRSYEGSRPGRIVLEVREKNMDARQFYLTMGFIETGRRKAYYGDDNAVLMERCL